MNNILIAEYDAHWPELFAKEAAELRRAFGASLVALEHIGSTAIPGLAAKSIIDIQATVRAISDVEEVTPALIALGWEQGRFGPDPEQHLYFKKHDASGVRTHQLHVYVPDHPAATAHLLFRDTLRENEDEARRYEALKRRLAHQYQHDRLAYSDAKTAFVKAILAKAREQRNG